MQEKAACTEQKNKMNDLDDFQQTSASCVRRTYLVTYSQADRVKFPTRESFGQVVEKAFNAGSGKVGVDYWACCLEEHTNGGQHYHVSLKLTGTKRWSLAKNYLVENHGVTVHFSDSHDNYYYSAYRYICKADTNVYHSNRHPNLQDVRSPKTKKCIKAYREKRKQQNTTEGAFEKKSKTKVRRLSNFDVSEFMVKNGIKIDTELFAAAHEQKENGKTELANFVLNRSPKCIQDLIFNTWKMQAAVTKLSKQNTSRIDTIKNCAAQDCVEGCNGAWLECAIEVLTENKVHPIIFAGAMRELLIKGRGKFRNIMIVGPANCAKTFMFKPLELIFETFSNPANDKYAWLGAEKCQLIFLNDFRWSREMIAWKELLLLLEGQIVHLPSPKNHYAMDIAISGDTPIVATGKSRTTYEGRFNTADPVENEMMASRWKVFDFFHQIPEKEQRDLPPCPKCFSTLTLMEEL